MRFPLVKIVHRGHYELARYPGR